MIGESGDQLDLLVGEWLRLGTTYRECADGLIFSQKRNRQNGPVAEAKREVCAIRELMGGGLKVVDVDRYTINEGAPSGPSTSDWPFGEVPKADITADCIISTYRTLFSAPFGLM